MVTPQTSIEVNFDGVIGPTHNYSGLSYGNMASISHRDSVSNPREAALQGLRKMKFLQDMGLAQALLPPQERPHLPTLRKLGFEGSDSEILRKAVKSAPEVFRACCSASSMWTANAATVAPSSDTQDGKVHFTPANLVSKFHRSIEHFETRRILKAVFPDSELFVHHQALPSSSAWGDEGAANHTRFCNEYGEPGLQLFIYGDSSFRSLPKVPSRFPARQTLEASMAVARLHQLDPDRVVFAQQNPEAIDQGVFHNDVASVGNRNVFFYHENAFADRDQLIRELNQKFKKLAREKPQQALTLIEVPASQVSLKDAVASYLFNTQLISLPGNASTMTLIAPLECQEVQPVRRYLERLLGERDSAISAVEYFDLHQSMRNGGGPACLRLRVVLTQEELRKTNPAVFMNDELYSKMTLWIQKYYRDRLSSDDLSDPQLLSETRAALDELTQILNIGSVYSFQS